MHMALSAGARLGPYEILAPLGVGGMGEVYKARDPRLSRLIAIKLLPGPAAMDPDRRERFEREAQAIAALNHPNIVTIHSTEEIDGRSILTMELVEGRSLADAIPKGGLPLDRLLKIAILVADAVAAAHQKGITHRDLKPANIMLGQGEHEGRVKVLDFGLAKLTDAATGTMGATAMPTAPFGGPEARPLTGEGRILGTVAYMSPEQAEGKTLDARSDLFSLGVILYEMATGWRPFTGDTSISVISSIVKDTPKSVTEVNAALPPELGRIVRHALTKDPERRYQSAKDLRNDLEELKRSLDSGELPAQGAASGATPRSSGARVWQWAALGLALASVAAIAVLLILARRRPESAVSPPTTPQIQMVRLTSSGNARLPALSPDGKFVAYVQEDDDQQSVWVRQIASNSNVRIVAPTPATQIRALTVTPDGSFVDFVRREGTRPYALWRVPFLGGTSRKLVDEAVSAPGWSPDGKQMAFLTSTLARGETHVVVADTDGSRPRVIATRKLPQRYLTVTWGARPDLRPVWLADGQSIAVIGNDTVHGIGNLFLVTVNVATGAETTLLNLEGYGLSSGMGMALARDGRSFILNKVEPDGSQQIVRVHPPRGDTTKLTNDLNEYAGVSLAGDAVVAARRETRSSVWLADAAGNGARISQDIPSRLDDLAWAAGGRVIYSAALVGGAGLWSTDVTGGASELIVPDGFFFSTSGDGRTLVFVRRRDNKDGLWRSDADGTHATRIATGNFVEPIVTPDGSAVLYLSSQSGLQSAWIVDLHGGAPRQFASVFVPAGGIDVSPDGRFVMLVSRNEKTRSPETLVVPITGGEPVRRLSRGGFRHWTPDGRALSYVDPSALNVWVQPLEGGDPRQLTHFTDGPRIVEFAWSPDGKQLALTRAIDTSDIVMLKGIR